VALLAPTAFAAAQQAQSTPTATPPPDLLITWPQPITEVHGVINVVGVAEIPGMAFYRLEAIALNSDYSVPENAAWIPLTTDQTTPVASGTLATIDTTSLPDGLYDFRLAAFTGTIQAPGKEADVTTGPIRVNNTHNGGTGVLPTPGPTATTVPADGPPSVIPGTGVPAVNIRSCTNTDNNACPVIGYIPAGGSATLIGIANDGSGWLQVSTAAGLVGWVSNTVVNTLGNTATAPLVAPPAPLPAPPPPPPPPPAPTAQPPAPPPPPGTGNVIPNGIGIQNNVTPQCGQAFNVQINVANVGSAVAAPGAMTLQDIHVDDGAVTYTAYGDYPQLNPGDNYVVVLSPVISSYPNTNHELIASNNGQQVTMRYTMGPGSCGGPAPTATPPPGPTPTRTPPPVNPFAPGQCTIQPKGGVPYYNYPLGQVVGGSDKGGKSYPAIVGTKVNGDRWYQFNNGSNLWVRQQDINNLPSSCKKF